MGRRPQCESAGRGGEGRKDVEAGTACLHDHEQEAERALGGLLAARDEQPEKERKVERARSRHRAGVHHPSRAKAHSTAGPDDHVQQGTDKPGEVGDLLHDVALGRVELDAILFELSEQASEVDVAVIPEDSQRRRRRRGWWLRRDEPERPGRLRRWRRRGWLARRRRTTRAWSRRTRRRPWRAGRRWERRGCQRWVGGWRARVEREHKRHDAEHSHSGDVSLSAQPPWPDPHTSKS